MARKIVITSGKGGVGKTTVCANLGIALAKLSKRVMLLDLDIGLNNLDVALGIESKVVYDFVDVVEGKCRPMQALVQDETEPTLYTMPTCHLAKRQISVDATKKVISRLSDMFDYILIDCPAGIDGGFRRASACADEAIVVTTEISHGHRKLTTRALLLKTLQTTLSVLGLTLMHSKRLMTTTTEISQVLLHSLMTTVTLKTMRLLQQNTGSPFANGVTTTA